MPTYIQKTTNSGLSPFTKFNKEMSAGTGTDTTLVVSLSGNETVSGGFITVADKPNSDAWEDGGTWTVELQLDVGNHQITARCRCVRLDSAGNIEETGSYTGTQTMDADRSFSPVAPTWETSGDANVCSDQIAIEIEFINGQSMANSITLGLGTIANEVITDITEDGGTCGGGTVVTPAALTMVAAAVGPVVILGSMSVTPASLTVVAAKVDPTVVLGSMTVTPAARTMVAAVVAPTVVIPEPQKQIFITGPGQQALSSGTRYNTVLSTIAAGGNWENTEATFQLIATPGTLRNFRIQLDTAVTSGTITFTIRKNAIDTALEVVMTSGTSAIDITNEVSVVAGDQINMKFVGSGNNVVQGKFGLEFEGDNDRAFNMSAGTSLQLVQTASTQFNTLIHHDQWNLDGGDRINVCPLDGTITDWYLELDVAPGSGESWTFRLVKNLTSEASSEIVISGTALTGNVTGLSIDIAPGDTIQMQAIRSSASVVVSQVQSGVAIKADTSGESWVGGNTDDVLTKVDTVTEFNLMGGGNLGWRVDEISVLQYAAGAFTLKNFRIRTNTGPGGTSDHLYTFRLRKDEANASSVVPLIDAETDKVDATNEDSYPAGAEIGVSHRYDLTGSGTPSTMRATWAAIQTVSENIIVTPAVLTMVGATVNPTVVQGSTSVTPAAATAVAAVVDPVVVLGSLSITPAVRTMVAAVVAPIVILGSTSVTPAALTTIAAVVDPVVVQASMSVTPASLTAVAAVIDPTVVISDPVVTPSPLTAVATVVDPTVILGSMSVTPSALSTVAAVVDPTVVISDLIITPAALTAVMATVDPVVVLGSMSVTPSALTAVTGKVDPTVILGSTSVTPSVLSAIAATVDPAVVLGSVSIAPAALTFVSGKVEPTVILGSLVITPTAQAFVAATINPTVVISGGGGGDIVTPTVLTMIGSSRIGFVAHSGTVKIFVVRQRIATAVHTNEKVR